MEKKDGLVEELKKLNNNLSELKNSGKHMIYSAKPFKFAFFNFLAGIFHSLGLLFGYIVIFGVIVYFLSRINLGGIINKWLEGSLKQIKWEQIMPDPKIPENLKNQ